MMGVERTFDSQAIRAFLPASELVPHITFVFSSLSSPSLAQCISNVCIYVQHMHLHHFSLQRVGTRERRRVRRVRRVPVQNVLSGHLLVGVFFLRRGVRNALWTPLLGPRCDSLEQRPHRAAQRLIAPGRIG